MFITIIFSQYITVNIVKNYNYTRLRLTSDFVRFCIFFCLDLMKTCEEIFLFLSACLLLCFWISIVTFYEFANKWQKHVGINTNLIRLYTTQNSLYLLHFIMFSARYRSSSKTGNYWLQFFLSFSLYTSQNNWIRNLECSILLNVYYLC